MWIRDILLRIPIQGSVPLTNGSGPGPAIFVIFKTATKNKFFLSFFAITVRFEGTFTSCFKDKKSLKSHTTVGIKVFLTIFAS